VIKTAIRIPSRLRW